MHVPSTFKITRTIISFEDMHRTVRRHPLHSSKTSIAQFKDIHCTARRHQLHKWKTSIAPFEGCSMHVGCDRSFWHHAIMWATVLVYHGLRLTTYYLWSDEEMCCPCCWNDFESISYANGKVFFVHWNSLCVFSTDRCGFTDCSWVHFVM